jgi:hypothetical protein
MKYLILLLVILFTSCTRPALPPKSSEVIPPVVIEEPAAEPEIILNEGDIVEFDNGLYRIHTIDSENPHVGYFDVLDDTNYVEYKFNLDTREFWKKTFKGEWVLVQ